jgi:hypothetical protein
MRPPPLPHGWWEVKWMEGGFGYQVHRIQYDADMEEFVLYLKVVAIRLVQADYPIYVDR